MGIRISGSPFSFGIAQRAGMSGLHSLASSRLPSTEPNMDLGGPAQGLPHYLPSRRSQLDMGYVVDTE